MFKTIKGGQLPQRATKYSAGFDVFANEDVVIGAGETRIIGLGICLDHTEDSSGLYQGINGIGYKGKDMDNMYFELHPRSSLRSKGLGGGVGIIDMDYREEIKMVITNPITKDNLDEAIFIDDIKYFEIKRGDKIGQMILKRHEGWLLPDEYTLDSERTGGFGSTGGVA